MSSRSTIITHTVIMIATVSSRFPYLVPPLTYSLPLVFYSFDGRITDSRPNRPLLTVFDATADPLGSDAGLRHGEDIT